MLQTKTYSVGSFDRYTGTSNGYILDLILTEEAVDVAANTSQVAYKLQLRSGPSNRFDWQFTATLALAGSQVAAVTDDRYLDYDSVWVLLEGETTVPHNADGSLDMAFSAVVEPWNGGTVYTPPALTLTGTMAMTRIPRASTIAATAACIGDAAAVVISAPLGGCTHTVGYQFGQLSGYLASAAGELSETPVQLTQTALVFPIPESFYTQIPDAPSGVCTLTCTTYQGDTQLGQPQTAAFTVTADPARCGPVVTGTAADVCEATLALTGSSQTLIQGQSAALCTPQITARQGATIREVYLNGAAVENAPQTLEGVMAGSFTFRAVDSRGYTAEYTVPDITLIAYVAPGCTARVARTDPTSGQAVLTVTGKWYPGSFGAADNDLQLSWRADGGDWTAAEVTADGGDFSAQVLLADLDYRTAHLIEVQVSDRLQTITKALTLSRGIPVFDWGEGDFCFHVPVRFTATDGTEFTLDLSGGQLTAIT